MGQDGNLLWTKNNTYPGSHIELDPNDVCHSASEAHDVFVFVFFAFLVGTVIKSCTMLPLFRNLQDTVVVFFVGVVFSIIQEKMQLYANTGPVGVSHCVWMGINARVLHFATLPALLTGDALAIDTSVARQVAKRCILLAGPGSLFCSLLNAAFLYGYLPYEWSWALSLTMGCILTATDPAAVLYILKELGAPPNLAVLIQGEALLNDGVALVLYRVAYDTLCGGVWSFDDVPFFLLKVVVGAALLGSAIGVAGIAWLKLSCKRLEHDSPLVQVFITLLCAYWSYIIAESFLGVSGVLATVAASLVLADKMWPVVVQGELIHQAWHIFEYVSSACVFFIAGALCGHSMFVLPVEDYIHCVVIYIVCMISRGLMLLLSTPALRFLNADRELVPIQDMAIMCWSSMQGAVGLSLAIQVSVEKGEGNMNPIDAQRVLFYTGGIAALTLIVNCHTCTALVKRLGIVGTSKTKLQLMFTMHTQLTHEASEFREVCGGQSEFLAELTSAVSALLDGMIKDVERNIVQSRLAGGMVPSGPPSHHNIREPDLVARLRVAQEAYKGVPKEMLSLLRLPRVRMTPEEVEEISALATERPTRDRLRAVNEAFFHWLKCEYMVYKRDTDQVEDDVTVQLLLKSVGYGLEFAAYQVGDLNMIAKTMQKSEDQLLADVGLQGVQLLSKGSAAERSFSFFRKSELRSVVIQPEESIRKLRRCNFVMVFVVIAHIIWISMEFLVQAEFVASMGDLPVLGVDAAFEVVFFAEFIFRLKIWGKDYLQETINIMDLSLLLICMLGTTTELSIRMAGHGVHVEWLRLVRLVRVLRAFWALNVAWRFAAQLKANPANCRGLERVAGEGVINMKRMQYLSALVCCVQAHGPAQQKLLGHFSCNGLPQCCEEARCILESHIEMFIASVMANSIAQHLDEVALECHFILKESNTVAGKLSQHVLRAHAAGLLGVRETESLLRPMRERINTMDRRMRRAVKNSGTGRNSNARERPAALQPGCHQTGSSGSSPSSRRDDPDEAFSGDSESTSEKRLGSKDTSGDGSGAGLQLGSHEEKNRQAKAKTQAVQEDGRGTSPAAQEDKHPGPDDVLELASADEDRVTPDEVRPAVRERKRRESEKEVKFSDQPRAATEKRQPVQDDLGSQNTKAEGRAETRLARKDAKSSPDLGRERRKGSSEERRAKSAARLEDGNGRATASLERMPEVRLNSRDSNTKAETLEATIQARQATLAERELAAAREREEAAKREAERLEAARQQEAARQEAARLEAVRLEAAVQETARQEAARQEAARQEAERREAGRQEAEGQGAVKHGRVGSRDVAGLPDEEIHQTLSPTPADSRPQLPTPPASLPTSPR